MGAFFQIRYVVLTSLFWGLLPGSTMADILHVYRSDMSKAIVIAPSTEVFLDIAEQFDEISIGNPKIADIWTISNKRIKLSATQQGQTTVTVSHSSWPETAPSQYEVIVEPGSQFYQTGDTISLEPEYVDEIIEYSNEKHLPEIQVKRFSIIILKTDFAFENLTLSNKKIIDAADMWHGYIYVLPRSVGRAALTVTHKDTGELFEFRFDVSLHSENLMQSTSE